MTEASQHQHAAAKGFSQTTFYPACILTALIPLDDLCEQKINKYALARKENVNSPAQNLQEFSNSIKVLSFIEVSGKIIGASMNNLHVK